MTPRQRYLATLLFEKPDRVPFDPGHGRKSTREAWYRQGLPPDVKDYHAYARKLLGIEPEPVMAQVGPGVDFRMIPQFEEKVIERKPAPKGCPHGSLIVQDWKGNICEISDEYDVTYLRTAMDFVTRAWLKCPVETRQDWEEMKARYVLNAPGRFPADWDQRTSALRNRTYVSGLHISGPFWQLREWLGFEQLCMLLLDDPKFAKDMIQFWQNFVTQLLHRMFENYVPDFVCINEDMAYKEKPMIGADMSREFLLPCWRAWHAECKAAGVPVYEVDSDGHVGELLPVFIEGGFNCNSPQEVAAGNDLPAYRRLYGKKISYRGGVDKRAMAKGGTVIKAEIDRLKPTIDAGGFIPSCDHGIPSDVSWPNFLEYSRLLAQATGWL